ncbi:MAG: DUF3247 family protein, partial [Luteimonas sp.]
VYTDDADIARLEGLMEQLPDEARVELLLADGSSVAGVVSVRPTVQTFLDPQGEEGINGVVRIDDAADPSQAHYVWLDVIRDVRPIDTVG